MSDRLCGESSSCGESLRSAGKVSMHTKLSGVKTNPVINDARVGIGEGRHSREPVVSVQDAQAERVLLQDDGHGECTCFFDVSAGGEKFYSRVSNVCFKCLHAANVPLDEGKDDVLRAWVEGSKREPGGAPLPRELADRLEALTVEHLKPSGSIR